MLASGVTVMQILCSWEHLAGVFFVVTRLSSTWRTSYTWWLVKGSNFFLTLFQSVKLGESELLHIIECNFRIFNIYLGNPILSRRFRSFCTSYSGFWKYPFFFRRKAVTRYQKSHAGRQKAVRRGLFKQSLEK